MPVASPVPLRAAAVVLLRRSGSHLGERAEVAHVALATSPGGGGALPQEWLDTGETEVQAAARAAPGAAWGPFLGTARDEVERDGATRRRLLSAWAMRVSGDDLRAGLRWVPVEEARQSLASELERAALERALAAPEHIGRVLLLRHCEAEQWRDGDDLLRPLTPPGRQRAADLADVVRALAPDELLTSPALRCRETLWPAAGALGVPLVEEPLVGEAQPDRDKTAAVLQERGRAGDSVLVCTHAPVVSALLERFAADRPALLPRPARLDAGGAWCVEFSADGPVGMHYLAPPALAEGSR